MFNTPFIITYGDPLVNHFRIGLPLYCSYNFL